MEMKIKTQFPFYNYLKKKQLGINLNKTHSEPDFENYKIWKNQKFKYMFHGLKEVNFLQMGV